MAIDVREMIRIADENDHRMGELIAAFKEERDRRIIEMREEGLPERTVADAVGCAPSTVNTHFSKHCAKRRAEENA